MPFIRQFSVNAEKHPTTIETIDNWTKQGINVSDKICQLIDAEAMKQQQKKEQEVKIEVQH